MTLKSLFNLLQDGKDLVAYFEGVDSGPQMVSRLERLKRQGSEEILLCVQGLRASITAILDESLEMGSSLEDEDTSELDAELEALSGPDGVEDAPEPEKKPEPEQKSPEDSAAPQ